jgi:hypothetical protein
VFAISGAAQAKIISALFFSERLDSGNSRV